MEPTPLVDAPTEEMLRSPIAQAPLSIILLAQGDEAAEQEAVAAWNTDLITLGREFEILLVRPTSFRVEASLPSVAFNPALGYGQALQSAIERAQYPLLLLTTADRQFQPADLQKLLGVIDHVDLVIGCRTVPRPWWRRLLSWCWDALAWVIVGLPFPETACTAGATPWRRRWATRWAFGLRLIDPESPFRLGRRETLARIVLQSRGPFVLVEQLAKANHLECILSEEPVAWTRPASTTPEAAPFASEAWTLFRRPDFGTLGTHLPGPAPPRLDYRSEPPASAGGVCV